MLNQRGFSPIFIVITLVILGVVAGGSFYYLNLKSSSHPTIQNSIDIKPQTSLGNKVEDNQKVNEVPSTQPIASISAENITGWKTYKGDGVTFKYPENATLTNREGMLFTKTSGIEINPPYQEPYKNYYSFGVSTIPNPKKLDAKVVIDNQINELKKGCTPPACGISAKEIKEYKVGGVNGYIFHFGAETDSAVVVTVRNDVAFVFKMTGDNGYVTDYGLNILDQILSTLEFTN